MYGIKWKASRHENDGAEIGDFQCVGQIIVYPRLKIVTVDGKISVICDIVAWKPGNVFHPILISILL